MITKEDDDVEIIKECELYFVKGKYNTCLNYLEKLSTNLTKLPSKYISNKFKKFCDHKTNFLFTQWSVQHNVLLCKFLSKTDDDESLEIADCSQYKEKRTDKSILEQLQYLRYQVKGVPLIKESLTLEITILYNWLNFLLLKDKTEKISYSKNEVWMEIIATIIQLFYVATGTELTLTEYDITTAFSLIKGILQHLNQLNEEKKIILLLFSSIAWFLIQHSDNKNALSLLESIIPYLESCESCNKSERVKFCWNTSASILPIEEWQDVIIITYIYCLLINNKAEKALNQFELLKETYRIPFIQYLKAITYFRIGKISEAINIAHEIWKKQYNCIENWLKARICNLLGCCFSLMGKHHVSKEWFTQAIDEDDSFYLPLKNICVEFQLLKHYSQEIESIQLLIKATANNNQKSSFQSADVNHLESLYMIAKRLLDNDQYEKSAEWFTHILSILENKGENQSYVHYNCTFMKLHTIYQQAAYAYLCSKNYNKCVEICTKLIENYFPKESVSEEINLQHNHNFETYLYIDDDNTAKILENMSSDIISLMLRSSAYYHLDEKEQSLSDLKKARITLQNKSDSRTKNDINNPTKKIKIESEGNEKNNETSTENSAIRILRSQVFNNLGVHCMLQKRHEEAIRLFRISLTCYPGNTDAAYNSSSLIAILNHKEEAVRSWIKFKKEAEEFNYLTSLTTEQIQSHEQIIKCSEIGEFHPKMIISDRISFSPSIYSVELGSVHLLKGIYIPFYISLD